jgi:hypothetical protein
MVQSVVACLKTPGRWMVRKPSSGYESGMDEGQLAIWAKALAAVSAVLTVIAGLLFGYVLAWNPEHRASWALWAAIALLVACIAGAMGNIFWQKRRMLLRDDADH